VDEREERETRELTRTCKVALPPRGRAKGRARGTRWENLEIRSVKISLGREAKEEKEGRKRTVLQSITVRLETKSARASTEKRTNESKTTHGLPNM